MINVTYERCLRERERERVVSQYYIGINCLLDKQ